MPCGGDGRRAEEHSIAIDAGSQVLQPVQVSCAVAAIVLLQEHLNEPDTAAAIKTAMEQVLCPRSSSCSRGEVTPLPSLIWGMMPPICPDFVPPVFCWILRTKSANFTETVVAFFLLWTGGVPWVLCALVPAKALCCQKRSTLAANARPMIVQGAVIRLW